MPVPVQKTSPGAACIDTSRFVYADMHFHTRHSDGRAAPAEAVARARELGVRLAITDHNVIGGALEAWRIAGSEATERILPGIELTTRERVHLLVYFETPEPLVDFFERVVRPNQRRGFTPTAPSALWSSDILEALAREGYPCLTAAPHPFAAGLNGYMSARERFAHIREEVVHLDAIEVLNGEEMASANARAAGLARHRGLAAVAGSDGHVLGEMGRVLLATPREKPLFQAIRERDAEILDCRTGAWALVLGHGAKIPYHATKPFRAMWDYCARRGHVPPALMRGEPACAPPADAEDAA